MKIGIDGRELLENKVTGIGRFVDNFIKHAPHIKPSWEFLVFGNQNSYFSFHAPNVKKIIVPEKSTLVWDQVKLPEMLRQQGMDLFFSPYYKTPFFSPCPTVITVHDVIPFVKIKNSMRTFQDNGGQESAFRYNPLLKLWSKFLSMNAAKILTVSHHSKKDIMELFGIPGEKIEVVHDGVGEEFKPRKSEEIDKVKRQYGIRGNYILYVGNFAPHKNVKGILEAYSKINRELQHNYQLVIGGKKDHNFKKIINYCAKLGIAETTIFPGYIVSDNLPALFCGADIFMFPSFYEGFGLPPLEAMACGTPVISSKRTCIPEILGDAAVLINPANSYQLAQAIENILTNNDLRQQLTEKGLKKASGFSFRKMSSEILNIFEGALG